MNIKISSLSVVLPVGGVTSEHQTASDLCFDAAERIFKNTIEKKSEIGGIVYVGASPDYRSPATACVLQGRLGLSQDCFAFDLNQGGAGFSIGLKIAGSLAASMTKKSILLLLGDTPSKWCDEETLQSLHLKDAGTAILIEESDDVSIIESQILTWSEESHKLAINEGGFRLIESKTQEVDFLFQSASKYGRLKLSDKTALDVNSILSRLGGLSSEGESQKWWLTGYFSDLLQNAVDDLDIPVGILKENYLGSSVPYVITQNYRNCAIENIIIKFLEIGEGFVTAYSQIEIESSAILPLSESNLVFDNWEVDHQM